MIDSCRHITGTVETVRSEEDGDVHLGVRLDAAYRAMLVAGNFSGQNGNLVVELMPRDHGHLPEPGVGDRLSIVGAYVNDSEHSWHEVHPVFALQINGGAVYRSGPQYGGDPPGVYSSSALASCHTNTGARCVGYGGVTAAAPTSAPPTPSRSGSGSGSGSGNCTPGYSPCIAPGSDVDCEGGSGDGPRYVPGPVHVTGSDPYGLDYDGNGVGCE